MIAEPIHPEAPVMATPPLRRVVQSANVESAATVDSAMDFNY